MPDMVIQVPRRKGQPAKVMKEFWDSRYNTDRFVYGKEPNSFFAGELAKLEPGKILLPGEGEGRNAVFAASMGWEVDAFDQSVVASQKALALAREMGVRLNYRVSALEEYTFKKEYYDAVGLTFFHLTPGLRKLLHRQVQLALVPGGVLILEAFHISQLGNQTGGPASVDMLFDKEMLVEDFQILEMLFLENLDVELNEGDFHRGEASTVRLVGKRKP